MSESGAQAANPKAATASAQIQAATQKNSEMLMELGASVKAMREILNDHSKILQELDAKMDSARLAAPKSSRAKGSGSSAGSSKKNDGPEIPTINVWFRDQWKTNEEETIKKYCVPASVESIKKAIAAHPKLKSKKGDALKISIAGAYFTRYFAKRDSEAYEEKGHKALLADHTAMVEHMKEEGEAGEAEVETTTVEADEE
jgi:hypothetical protein